MKAILLTRGYASLVDDADYESASLFKWCVTTSGGRPYAFRSEWADGKNKTIFLHRWILRAPVGAEVDHRDGDGLNNTRANLRLATRQQNARNSKPKNGRRKGWVRRKSATKPYVARIRYGGRNMYIGVFATEEEAARAYDKKARELFGEFARCNFQEERRT